MLKVIPPAIHVQEQFELTKPELEELEHLTTPPDHWEIKTIDVCGKKLRTVFSKMQHPKNISWGLVTMVSGRAQPFEEHFEIARECHKHGLDFISYDRQGQGESYTLVDRKRHHLADWRSEIQDHEYWMRNQVIGTTATHDDPIFQIGHSMGSAVSTISIQQEMVTRVTAAAQIGPFYGLYEDPKIQIYKAARHAIEFAVKREFRGVKLTDYATDTKEWSLSSQFEQSKILSNDRVRRALQCYHFLNNPKLECGGPTWGLGIELLKMRAHMQKSGFAESLQTPMICLMGDQEVINSTIDAKALFNRLPNPSSILQMYKGKHQGQAEIDSTRQPLFDDIFAFFKSHAPHP